MSPAVHHPIFARLSARMSRRVDAKGAGEHRRETLAGLTGRVIERCRRFPFKGGPVTVPHIIGLARRTHRAPAGGVSEPATGEDG
jgi:hypothetical protein